MATKDDLVTLITGVSRELATATEALEHTVTDVELQKIKGDMELKLGRLKGRLDLMKRDDDAIEIRIKALEDAAAKKVVAQEKDEEKSKDRVWKAVMEILKLVAAAAIGGLTAWAATGSAG
jgi:hypothetical protein